MKTLKKLLVITCIVFAGCTSVQPHPSSINLPKPVRPILPIIQSSEIECLSDDTSFKIQKRQLLLRQYSEQLESVIDSLNSSDN